jgi:hypothetical protein
MTTTRCLQIPGPHKIPDKVPGYRTDCFVVHWPSGQSKFHQQKQGLIPGPNARVLPTRRA